MTKTRKILKRLAWILGGLLAVVVAAGAGVGIYLRKSFLQTETRELRPLDPASLFWSDSSQAFNPYLPAWEYVPDGEPHLFGDRLYVYGSHDRFNGESYCLNDYVAWSADPDNLKTWRYEGVIYRRDQDPLNADGRSEMNAPDVIRGTDGKYYLYYSLSMENAVSVAVADFPAGPYEFYGHVQYPGGKLLGEENSESGFDPGVFRDEDGRLFVYTGFCTGGFMKTMMAMAGLGASDFSMVTELEADMLTVKGAPVSLIPGEEKAMGTDFEGHGFFEASSMRKIGERYYLIYSSQRSHDLCYALSDSPTGPFAYGGILISIADIGLPGITGIETARNYVGNTHGSLVRIHDQWYVFYHRQTNQHSFSRQACAEAVTILPDGRIPQVEVTSQGLNGGPLKGIGTYSAHIACNLFTPTGTLGYDRFKGGGGDLEKHPYFTQDGPDREDRPFQYIANFQDGSTAGFKYFDFDSAQTVSVAIRGAAKGVLTVQDGFPGREVARIEIDSDGGMRDFQGRLSISPGTHPLFFTYAGEGRFDFLRFGLSAPE